MSTVHETAAMDGLRTKNRGLQNPIPGFNHYHIQTYVQNKDIVNGIGDFVRLMIPR